jgi:hypothetical protein
VRSTIGRRLAPAAFAALAAGTLAACASPLRVAALDEMDRVRASESAREAAALAPEAFAHAEGLRDRAHAEHTAGDDVGATLDAERASAAFGHALVIARQRRAAQELADASKALESTTSEQSSLDPVRAQLEHEAAELEQRAGVARAHLLPAPSAVASSEREAARLVAARSLSTEARLLCAATRLVAPEADGLADLEKDVTALEERLERPQRAVPIDDAARARARCLELLTRARRGSPENIGRADALLAEISATGGWDPERDERGVVVTLRGAYRGTALTEDGAAKLGELGRVAAAHPAFAVQVVVHDAVAPSPRDDADARRGQAAVQALIAGGAPAARIHAELGGVRAPVADPADPAQRGRNERLEVVFVNVN